VVHALKKEVTRSKAPAGSDDEANSDRSAEYNELLIGAIHACAVKFPDVAATVVPVLMEFLADSHQAAAVDVALFVREIVEVHKQLAPSVIAKAMEMFSQITSARVLRICLWLLGEYCVAADEVAAAFTAIKAALGKLPLIPAAGEEEVVGASQDEHGATMRRAAGGSASAGGRTTVLADGTYSTQGSVAAAKPVAASAATSSAERPAAARILVIASFTVIIMRGLIVAPQLFNSTCPRA
jgi:coatomer subunit beta